MKRLFRSLSRRASRSWYSVRIFRRIPPRAYQALAPFINAAAWRELFHILARVHLRYNVDAAEVYEWLAKIAAEGGGEDRDLLVRDADRMKRYYLQAARPLLPPLMLCGLIGVPAMGDDWTRSRSAPLSPAQSQAVVPVPLQGPGAAYNLPLAIRLSGRLDEEALDCGLQDAVRRHAALRTVVRELDGEPYQQVIQAMRACLALHKEQVAQALLTAPSRAPPGTVSTSPAIRPCGHRCSRCPQTTMCS